MKVKNEFVATAKDGKSQKFNAYPRYNSDGSVYHYVTRFYFLDENNKWDQWCGKLCTYKKQKDAIAFGYKIAAAVSKATDLDSIKKVVEINSAYKKVFS